MFICNAARDKMQVPRNTPNTIPYPCSHADNRFYTSTMVRKEVAAHMSRSVSPRDECR